MRTNLEVLKDQAVLGFRKIQCLLEVLCFQQIQADRGFLGNQHFLWDPLVPQDQAILAVLVVQLVLEVPIIQEIPCLPGLLDVRVILQFLPVPESLLILEVLDLLVVQLVQADLEVPMAQQNRQDLKKVISWLENDKKSANKMELKNLKSKLNSNR